MLRITEERTSENSMTLRVEGRLAGPWVTLLETSCAQFLQNNGRVTLELAEVTFTDQAGTELLIQLQQQQVTLKNCSPFLQEQMKPAQTGQLAVQPKPCCA